MDTHLAGIICHAVSIFATSVSITTTEGNVDTTLRTVLFYCILRKRRPEYGYMLKFGLFLSSGSHKDGYETFASWKKVWTSNGKSEPSLKAFMADQQLPFWVSTGSIPASC